MTEDEVIECMATMSNWGRWGSDDERGMLNLITPHKRAAAAALVRAGITVRCGRLIEFAPRVDHIEAPSPPQHFMQASGEVLNYGPCGFASDWVSLPVHGGYMTHLDAPSHVFWREQMYNGAPASLVSSAVGAKRGSIDVASDGIVTRGVLLDVPAASGRMIADGEGVTGDDLRAAEHHAGVTVEAGDAVFVRTGYGARRPTGSDVRPGLSTDCLPFLWERQPAVLATDCPTDLHPSGYPTLNAPVHVVTIVAMGGWIIDNCDFEQLAVVAAQQERFEFMVSICPLRLKNSTGSPVNPIAIL